MSILIIWKWGKSGSWCYELQLFPLIHLVILVTADIATHAATAKLSGHFSFISWTVYVATGGSLIFEQKIFHWRAETKSWVFQKGSLSFPLCAAADCWISTPKCCKLWDSSLRRWQFSLVLNETFQTSLKNMFFTSRSAHKYCSRQGWESNSIICVA